MRVPTRVECGIIALVDMAVYSRESDIITVSSIAERENISVKYLEQIFTVLRQAKIVKGLKGSKGGYIIARPSEKITVRDIIDALDINILSDVSFEDYLSKTAISDTINVRVWDKMTQGIQTVASRVTLADLAEEYRSKTESAQEAYMYFI